MEGAGVAAGVALGAWATGGWLLRRPEETKNLPLLTQELQEQLIRGDILGHIAFTVDELVPRIEAEVEIILAQGYGEVISAGDFFHTHLRLPTEFRGQPTLATLNDPKTFHLQYHTYEYPNDCRTEWKRQLEQTDDPEVLAWLKVLEERNQKTTYATFP